MSSASSMWITCPIFGLFVASGSTHRREINKARLRAFEDGISGSLGSTTSSDFLFPTIVFNHSIKLTWNCSDCILSQKKREDDKYVSSCLLLVLASNLSLWSTVINRTSSSYYLHDKDSKAINITLLSQHSSAGIFWCNITTGREKGESLSFWLQ